MKPHPLLRAYMAGITVPTMFMLVILSVYCTLRFGLEIQFPLERFMVFPMAMVPNLFGIWNIVYVSMSPEKRLPIGLHGALLPFILAPLGTLLARALDLLILTQNGMVWFETVTVPYTAALIIFPVVVAVYYLAWKHLVGFCDALLGVA